MYRAEIYKVDQVTIAGKTVTKTHKVDKLFHSDNPKNVARLLKKYGWNIKKISTIRKVAPRRI